MNETKQFTAIPGYHVATAQLIEKLRAGNPGDVLTDDDLKVICGHATDPGGDGYNYLRTAIRYVRNLGIVWERQRGTDSIKCLQPIERLSATVRRKRMSTRHIDVAIKISGSINAEELPEPARKEHQGIMNQLRLMRLFGKKKTAKQLEDTTMPEKPNPAKLLQFFGAKAANE